MSNETNVETPVVESKSEVTRSAAIPQSTFDAFMQSGETKNYTIAECGAKLGFAKKESFVQRLTAYRKSLRNVWSLAEEKGLDTSKLPKEPEFKPSPRGRGAGKQEYNATERALLAMAAK